MIGQQQFFADQAPAEMAVLADALDTLPLTPAMEQCADRMRQAVRDNFTSSANPDGDDWLPRKHPGDGHPLLIDTGALLQAATGGGAGHLREVGEREAAIGVDGGTIPYAGIHNEGGQRMPQREFAGLTPEREDECEAIIEDFIAEAIFG